MKKFLVKFEGGDWGGRELEYDTFPGYRLTMPARVRARAGPISETGTLPRVEFPTDEYEQISKQTVVGRTPEEDRYVLTFRYQRPDIEGMQRELRRLRERVYELENPPRRGLMRFGR